MNEFFIRIYIFGNFYGICVNKFQCAKRFLIHNLGNTEVKLYVIWKVFKFHNVHLKHGDCVCLNSRWFIYDTSGEKGLVVITKNNPTKLKHTLDVLKQV
jgi:hypothetical protein